MKRVFTATCLAATFAVGLAAQTTGTAGTATADPQAAGQRGGGPRTVTGCLRAGDTAGTYMLTDVTMAGGRAGGATAGATGSTAGSTAGSTPGATGTAASGGAAAGGGAPMSIMLTAADASVDLKAHVGHKMEVVGTMAGGRGRAGDAGAGATGTATGTTASGTAGAGRTASGTATGTGTTASGTSTGATGTQGGGRGPRNMSVTSVRMISESCS